VADGEETRGGAVVVGDEDVADEGAHAVVEAETGLVIGVEGEEEGVEREEGQGGGEAGPEEGGRIGAAGC